MMKKYEVWEKYDHRTKYEVSLNRQTDGSYVLCSADPYDNSVNIDLDRKDLKDLFNAIGNELGAF
jgi:hypothetical protein